MSWILEYFVVYLSCVYIYVRLVTSSYLFRKNAVDKQVIQSFLLVAPFALVLGPITYYLSRERIFPFLFRVRLLTINSSKHPPGDSKHLVKVVF